MINLLYILKLDGKHSFLFCNNYMDKTVMSFRDKWKAIDNEESAYVFLLAYMIPEDFHTIWVNKLRQTFLF